MTQKLPKRTQIVIIGGGIHGCSVAYHLAKQGWRDVVLLERKQLTSGTTWHAAGLVGQLQGSHATTGFAKYGIELLQEIESETGQNPGFHRTGSISIATNEERLAELKRKADFASLFDVEASFIPTAAIKESWPLLNAEGVLGGIYMPSDGSANPTDLTVALAKGARLHGATLFENIKVENVLTDQGRVTGVRTDNVEIQAEFVVNCTGMWAREFGQKHGVGVPLHACEHYYLVTEPISGLSRNLPVLRSYCDGTYWNIIRFAFQCADRNPVGLHDDCSAAIVATPGAPAVRCHDISGIHGAQRECVHPQASDAWAWKKFARAAYLKEIDHRSPVHQVRGMRAAALTLV